VPSICSYPIIIIIILGLETTNEGEHGIFGFLSLTYLTQHEDLQFHPFSWKWHNFIFLYDWVIFYRILYIFTKTLFSLPVHHLLGISANSTVLLLLREIQQTWVGSYLSFILVYTPSDICPRLVWQVHKVRLVFEEPPYQYQSGCQPGQIVHKTLSPK
jgi:hypothetical protein